ncbi:MAG: hypothetical protein AAGB51_02550 [Planctomycetota bacterium]
MTASAAPPVEWTPQPEARAFVNGLVERFLAACARSRELAARMADEAGTRFGDWVDHIQTPDAGDRAKAEASGFTEKPSLATSDGCPAFVNEAGLFPPVVVGGDKLRVAIKVDSVSDFLATWQLSGARVQGRPLSQLRTAVAFVDEACELLVVERHGALGFGSISIDANLALRSMSHYERLRCRRRDWYDLGEGFADLRRVVESAVAELGQDLTCDLFFRTEREYWMRRNAAARAQKARQDRLGLGWANHDHHVYRSSRSCFTDLISVLEAMGMRCRERVHAGDAAGWGAQVLEHPVTGIVVLAETDMDADEAQGGFAHKGFGERDAFGTVGLWCALHGEAILNAGLHRLGCAFDAASLDKHSETETWPIAENRVVKLLQDRRTTAEQAEVFRTDGAVGSTLEGIQRALGFKGFDGNSLVSLG